MNILSIFLDRGENEHESQGQKNPSDKLQPQLSERPEEISKNDFQFPTHGGYKRADKQTLA